MLRNGGGMLTDPAQCTRYRFGHGLDMAEAKLAWRYASQKPVSCRFLELEKDGTVMILDEDGHHHEVWNHDPQKLIDLSSRTDFQVGIAPFNHHLRIYSGGLWYAISICSNEGRTPCEDAPSWS
jgi:hypothetical protein